MPNPIATRTWYDITDSKKKFVLEIDSPRISGAINYWHCEIRVAGAPEGFGKMAAGGNDGYRALASAMAH